MPLTTTINDVIRLQNGAGPGAANGDIWTPAAGELASVADGYSITTADGAGNMAPGDTIDVGGVTMTLSSIEAHGVDISHSDGAGGTTVVAGKMIVLSVVNPVTAEVMHLAMFPDASGNLPEISAVEITDAVLPGGGLGVESTLFAGNDAVTLAGAGPVVPGAPDGIVDGLDAGEEMGSGYVDVDGDEMDNSGNVIEANGGNDTVFGGTGSDTISGGDGQDFLFGGDGDDLVSGNDGNDSIWGDAGQDTLFGNDGNDKLVGGTGDDLLVGGAGNDTMYGDGISGDLGGQDPSDPAEPGFGNDTLVLDGGSDIAFGGSGDDVFQIFDGFQNHEITGGETGEIVGDRIDGSTMTNDVSVTYTGNEAGSINYGTGNTHFVEIETLDLGSGDDTVEVLTSTTGTVNGSDGFDTLVLPDPVPGDPAPVVTITAESPYPGIPGATTKTGFVVFPDGSRMDFENFEEIICFTPGTLIDTLRGRVAVEALVAGDRVLTRDHGYQPLIWAGRRDLTAAEMARCPAAAPIRIAAGALGRNLPERDLLVSPRHRMLITGARAELMFGEREVLVTAADLLGLPGVSQEAAGAVSYVHVMCEAHQIIRAEGAWSESFQPGEAVLGALDAGTRAELLALFPALGGAKGFADYAAARPVLNGTEARLLFAA